MTTREIYAQETLNAFVQHLVENEKSRLTVEKYVRDVRRFMAYVDGGTIDKQRVLDYKTYLFNQYAVRSANSMLAALNMYLRFAGRHDLTVKQYKIQKDAYCSEEKELTKEEYLALIRAADQKQNRRLSLVIQTICATGIRVSELSSITIEAVKKGEAVVSCKGKIRRIFIIEALRKKLLQYAREMNIHAGPLFVEPQP